MKKDQNNVTENVTNETTESALIITRDNASKAITAGVNLLFDVTKVQTLSDCDIVLSSFNALTGMVALPVCKVFERVKRLKLYAPDYKSFEQWASKRGVKKATAYNYAKVGAFLDESGLHSTLFHNDDCDYNYSQLVIICEKLDYETAVEWANDFRITPKMSVQELRRLFNPKRVTAKEDEKTDETTEKTDEKADETTEKTDEKTTEIKETKTQKQVRAIFNRWINTEYVEDLLPILLEFDKKCTKDYNDRCEIDKIVKASMSDKKA